MTRRMNSEFIQIITRNHKISAAYITHTHGHSNISNTIWNSSGQCKKSSNTTHTHTLTSTHIIKKTQKLQGKNTVQQGLVENSQENSQTVQQNNRIYYILNWYNEPIRNRKKKRTFHRTIWWKTWDARWEYSWRGKHIFSLD